MKKILLIDDIRQPEWIRNPHCEDESNYKIDDVEIARCGEDGVELLKANKYDVLLLDHDMGTGMSGMGVIRFLYDNQDRLPDKIFLVTANIVMGPLMMEYLQEWKREGKISEYGWIR